jgi:lysophospholipase L1-like esterase
MTGTRRPVRWPAGPLGSFGPSVGARVTAGAACLLGAAVLAGCGAGHSVGTHGTAAAGGTVSRAGATGPARLQAPAAGGHGAKAAGPATMAGRYVALGDSFTSAPLVPDQGGLPLGCLRSDQDYPSLVAAALHPSSFADVSCYGAATAAMTSAQKTLNATNPPQLNALGPDDTLVTVQVGGDDIGVGHIATTCAGLSLTSPFGSPCTRHYTEGGTDQLAQAVAATGPKVASVLRAIAQRAPHARILIVGYPAVLPATGNGCWPEVPIAAGDVPYLRGIENQLNAMLATEAARNGATFVNTYAASIGHDACQPPSAKWTEGLVPTSLAVPFHPNAHGEQAMAREILAARR